MTAATVGESLQFTQAAARKVRELMHEEGNPDLKLRVYIQGGGCSGFQYGFSFEAESQEDDLAVARRDPDLDPEGRYGLRGAPPHRAPRPDR